MKLVKQMAENRMVMSLSEARRSIHQKGVRVNGEIVDDIDAEVKTGDTIQLGKRDVIRIGEEPDSKSGAV